MTRHNKKYILLALSGILNTVVICIGSILPIGGILELIMGAEEFHLSTKSVSIHSTVLESSAPMKRSKISKLFLCMLKKSHN